MPRLSLYASRYYEFRTDHIESGGADRLITDSHHLDIACVDSEKIKIQCWLNGESYGRQWGRLGKDSAAILPFHIGAASLPKDLRLADFEIEIIFGSTITSGTANEGSQKPANAQAAVSSSEVYLLDVPRPKNLTGHSGAECCKRPWTFRGISDTNFSTGRSNTGRWIWSGNNHEPLDLLHGAFAIRHPDQPFRIACNVSGSARRWPYRYQFKSDAKTPRWWQLIPPQQYACPDLQSAIAQLEEKTREAIVRGLKVWCDETAIAQNEQNVGSQTSTPSPPSRVYGSVTADGAATLLLGDNITNVYYQRQSNDVLPTESSGSNNEVGGQVVQSSMEHPNFLSRLAGLFATTKHENLTI